MDLLILVGAYVLTVVVWIIVIAVETGVRGVAVPAIQDQRSRDSEVRASAVPWGDLTIAQ